MDQDKKPHELSSSPSSESDHVVDSLTPNQRVILLLKLLQDNPTHQKSVDELVKKILKQENVGTVQKLKKEVTDIDKANDIVRSVSPSTKDKKKPMQFEHQQANQKYIEEYKKFWYENIKKEDTTNTNAITTNHKASNADVLTPEELKRLSNYVPRLILRRLLSNPNPIKAPEIENYPAAAVFADISGFTPLTEKLASLGLEGIEKLTTVLNAYFGKLIEIIYKHGGDIIKFAGDAVLVVWPTASRAGLGGAILLACQCSKALLNDLGTYEVEGTNCTLRLHIGVGAGEIAGINVGGTSSQMEFFISGQVLEQVSSCEKQAEPGEVYVSAIAWMLVDPGRLIGVQKGKGAFSNYRLDRVEAPADLPPVEEFPIYPSMGPALKGYVQAAVKRHVSSGSTRWLAELRNVTVIFLNLTTPFKEYRLPELQNAIAELQGAVYRFEGTVRQFMIDDKGSVLIAGFGLPPLRHEDDPVRAVECALEMYAILQKMQIPCSIGVTTGKAFCGDVGSESRREYAMVGDIVNLSARLMVAAKMNILTDIDTYEACRSYKAIQFEKLEDIRVKGKTNPIAIYRPGRSKQRKRGMTRNSFSSSSLGYIANTIVGRDEELKIIRTVVNQVRRSNSSAPPAVNNNTLGRPRSTVALLKMTEIEAAPEPEEDKQSPLTRANGSRLGNPFLIIEGNDGMGKSRLLKQAESYARQGKEPIIVFSGAGDQLNSTKAYHGWQDILESVLDDKRKVPDHIISLLTPELAPLLNGILPIEVPETDKVRQMSGQLKLEATQQLILKLLRLMIKKGSLVCLDNAQWLDSGSWAVLAAATQVLDGVAFILAMRPTKSLAFQYSQMLHRTNTQIIKLRLLTDAETTLMIAHRLGLKKVPEVISKEIIRRAQGVPFIAEQIVGVIRDSGALQKTKNDELIMTPEIEAALKTVPDSVSAVLTSKVDKLNPSQQIVLKVASVIGLSFNFRLLNQLLPQETDKSNIKKDLQSLEKLEMIIPVDPEPNPSFCFANSLLRDVVYNLMLFAQKRQIHKNISEILLKEYAGNSAFYPLMAHHLKQAEADQEAISFFLKSGSLCLSQFANKEAVTFFTEAIQLTDKLNTSHSYDAISMKRKLGQAYYNLGQFDKADEFLRQAMSSLGIEIPLTNQKIKPIKNAESLPFSNQKEVEHSEIPHRRREAVLILLALTRVHYYACNKPIAVFCASLALQLAGSSGSTLLGEAYALSSITCGANSEYKMAESYIAKGIEVAGKTLDVLKVVMQMGGMAYTTSSQWGTAEECFNRAIEAAGTVGDIRTKEESQIFLGYAFFLQGQIEKSIKLINEGLDSAVSRGDPQTQVLALNALAINYYVSGDFDKCIKCLDGVGVALAIGAKDASAEMNYYALMALVHFRVNEIDDSLRCAEITFHLLGKLEPTCFFTFTGYSLLAEVYIIMSMYPKSHDKKITRQKLLTKGEKAISFLEKFSEIFTFAQPRCYLWKGALNFLNSKQSKASKDWSKGLEIAKQHGLKYEQALVLYQRGILTNDSKDITEAGDLVPEIKSRALDLSTMGVRRSMINPLKDSGEDNPAV